MFWGVCKLRWQQFTWHLKGAQSCFSGVVCPFSQFIMYWSNYWGFSHHPVLMTLYVTCHTVQTCFATVTLSRWAPDSLRNNSPFSQTHVVYTVNWKLFRFIKATEGDLRHYICHSSLLGSILKVSLSWCNCPPFHKRKRFIENQISGYGPWWQQKKNAEFTVCFYSWISGVIVAGHDGELAVINLSSI